jgi:transcription elongation factor Elf1
MIIVKEKKAVPHADVRCGNCGSLLQYGNADLHEDYGRSDGMTCASQGLLRPYYFNCPVCGCKVNANWIINKGEEV